MAKEKEVLVLKNYELNKPSDLVSMATVLKKHIANYSLFTIIQKKAYVHVEGWQVAGALLGLIPIVEKIEKLEEKPIEYKGEDGVPHTKDGIKYMVTVNIFDKNDRKVGIGFAVCSNREAKKRSFDEYAILSMAQTRATGKAYRNLLGWVMKISGYESTPAEEMTDMPATETSGSAEFDKAVSLVKASKSVDSLLEYEAKMKKGNKFTDEQKAELSGIISNRITQLDLENEKTS